MAIGSDLRDPGSIEKCVVVTERWAEAALEAAHIRCMVCRDTSSCRSSQYFVVSVAMVEYRALCKHMGLLPNPS